jgi:transcriptional regulator with XRE-family HTH domain
MTQASLAERLGNTQTFISKVERGERRLDVVDFLEWCEALGANPVRILAQLQKMRTEAKSGRGKLATRSAKS